eukprot:sb/3464605/
MVLAHAVATFQAKFRYFVENTEYMDQLFEVSFTKLSETGKPLSKCGRCTRYMKLINQRPTRLHCKNCDETYKLPQGGSIKLYQGNRCPLDQFELVVFNAGGKSFILCPYCYNFPEIEEMPKNAGCNRCPHPTCPNAAPQLSITACQICEDGELVLDPNSDSLPPVEFKKGQRWPIREPRLNQKETSPPDHLTESELITLMEKHGVGTDASIPVHINNICERNFVTIGSGRRLIPNTLGILLVHGYQRIDPDLVKPTMRSQIEKQFDLIATGRANYDMVLAHAVATFQAKFRYFVENTEYMDQLFEVSFTKLSETGKPLSKCGRCTRYMKLINQRPTRLHCKNCDETYKLPQGGSIKLYQGNRCPLDQFELVVFNAGGKSFILCPYCYNFPEIEEMPKNAGCNRCPHPTCPNAAPQLSITACQICEDGELVLDPNSGRDGQTNKSYKPTENT